MRQFVALAAFFLVIAAIDSVGRFFRFRRNPRAWSARTIAISALVWTVALMLVGRWGQNGLAPIELLIALVFGALCFGVVWSIGRVVLRESGSPDRSARRL